MKKNAPCRAKPSPRRTKRTVDKKETDRTVLAKGKFLAAFARLKGNISKSCRASHVGRTTYYEWLRDDPAFKSAVDVAFEAIKDHVEDQLHKLINRCEPSAIYFFLKTRAKDRGYVERQEIGGNLNLTGQLSINEMRKSMKEVADEPGH